VGKADDPFRRLHSPQGHLKSSFREDTYKARWIRELTRAGLEPVLEILDEVLLSEWQFWECEWIRLCSVLGHNLTNATPGGDGVTRHSVEALEKNRAAHTGKVPSPETREKMRVAHIGHKHSSESRARIAASKLGKPRSYETRQKLSMARRKKKEDTSWH
jgi:hypothetical protein